jgi:hypothetical protein
LEGKAVGDVPVDLFIYFDYNEEKTSFVIMSRPTKRIKLEPGPRSNGHRKEVTHPLYSGQFMTSNIDNDKDVNYFLK